MFYMMKIKLSFLHLFTFIGSIPELYGSLLHSRVNGNSSLEVSLRQCILTIGSSFLNKNKEIIHLRNRKTFKGLDIGRAFEKNFDWTFYSADLHFLSDISRCYDKNYLMEVESYEDAASVFQVIKQKNCWNPNQNIFIFSSIIAVNQSAPFFHLISLIHKNMLCNVIIMLPSKKNASDLRVYHWASEVNEKCGKIMYPHFFSCRFGTISGLQEGYKDTSVCSLKVKAIVWPPFVLYKGETTPTSNFSPVEKYLMGGVEVELMNLVSEKLGINVEYFISSKEGWGRSFFNGSTTKSMEELTTQKIDIVIGSLSVSLSRYFLFATSSSYIDETLVCCVPSDGYYSTFFNNFIWDVEFTIVTMLVLMTFLIWLTAKFNKKELQIYNRPSTIFLYNFAAMFGNSVSILPRTRRVRMLFLMIIIFEVFYMAFYQSLLTSDLSDRTFKQEIKTLKAILDRNMNIYSQPENHRYLEVHEGNKMAEKISKLWVNCDNTIKCLENSYKSKREAICLGKMYMNYILQNHKRRGRSPFYCLRHEIISYPVVMVMRKTIPFKRKIDKIIGRAIASGFVDKWLLSLFYNGTRESFIKPEVLFGILGYSDLESIFLTIIVLLVFSCLVFMIETLFHLLSAIVSKMTRVHIGSDDIISGRIKFNFR